MEKQNDIANFRLADRLREINKLAYDLTPEEMYATGVFILHDKTKQTIEVFDYGHGFIWLKEKMHLPDFQTMLLKQNWIKCLFWNQ